uniref:EGF-like domain-containing protein n=1 Tax=Ditylenchus dipsaci TaxID=166011 RepID=A0A915CUE1_9BILA
MQKTLASLMVVSLLVCSPLSAREFVRSFKLLSDITNSDEDPKGYIQKMTKIDPIPELAEVPTVQSKQLISNVDSDSSAYDPCKVSVLCRNNGVCESRGNEYYCKCPDTHYGKTCEFIADLKECDGNQCMNNSTCYSTKESKVVPNPEVLARLSTENQDFADFENVTMSVKYECWCQHGFEGTFCEFSEGMRRCSEDKCNHHGIVVPFYQGSDRSEQEGLECKCHCEEGYSGDECEYVSPCRDFQCTNNGTCKIDSKDGTAYCQCPASVELFPSALISGPHCASISVDDDEEKDPCFPCQEGQNFTSFLECLEDRASISSADLKSMWWADCETQNPNCLADLENSFCFNGTCQEVVSRLPLTSFSANDKLYLLPKCHCREGYEGNFCEREVNESCDLHCVHGNCCYTSVDNPECYNNFTVWPEDGKLCNDVEQKRGFRCMCPPGLKQPFCQENVTACDSHRCLNGGKCVQMPNSSIDYTCDCPLGYSGTFCHISLGVCLREGDAACVNGVCVEDSNTRRGFRCKCKAGYGGFNSAFAKSSFDLFRDNYAWLCPLIAFVLLMSLLFVMSAYQLHVGRRNRAKDNAAVVSL